MNTHKHTSLRKGIISALAGLALVVLIQFGASELVRAQGQIGGGTSTPGNVNMEDVVPFITKNSSDIFTRIGSLAVGSTVAPSWFYLGNCTRHNPSSLSDLYTCLDVNGSGNFRHLWLMQQALVGNRVVVTDTASGTGGGGSGFETNNARFVIENLQGSNDSMLVSGLGRHPAPLDYTTLRPTCATINGMLTNCAGETNPPVHGVCAAPPHGATYSSFDATKVTLCATGTASAVTDRGVSVSPRWTWTCSGSNGGDTANCSAGYTAPDPSYTYSWAWGSWGACSQSGFGTGTGVCYGNTSQKKPESNNICTSLFKIVTLHPENYNL